jgi:hypothetical protein
VGDTISHPYFYFMLSTKHLVQTYRDVPTNWIFEYYCKLPEKLSGQDVKIHSLFNPKDKTPSMCVFFHQKDSKYYFKDFSTGKGGTAIKLIQELFKENIKEASGRVISDYNQFVLTHNGTEHAISEFKVRSKYKVVSTHIRSWMTQDKIFWSQYGISSKLLETYNVCPLESYRMEKTEDGELKSLEITGAFIYGYYKKNGELYKIYQPKVKEHKFIKISSHLQGYDQLEGHPYLLICSSLKDMLTVKAIGLKIDVVAPDSENTLISQDMIENLETKYKKIITLFDNDTAGIAAMKKYKELYGFEYVYLDMEKDVADAVKKYGQSPVFVKLIPAINKKLN